MALSLLADNLVNVMQSPSRSSRSMFRPTGASLRQVPAEGGQGKRWRWGGEVRRCGGGAVAVRWRCGGGAGAVQGEL